MADTEKGTDNLKLPHEHIERIRESLAGRPAPNAGKKVVGSVHVVFRADDRTVKSIHPDQASALLAAQGDLLKPGAVIHGVVEVGFGDNVQTAIDTLIAQAADG